MPLSEILARARVLIGALPSRLAGLAALLTWVSVKLVPVLPAPVGVKVAAWAAAGLAFVAGLARIVAKLTEVPLDAIGLILPEGKQLYMEVTGESWPAGYGPDNPPPSRTLQGTGKPPASSVRVVNSGR